MIKKIFFYTSNIVTIFAPITLLFFPADTFDKGDSLCLSVQLADIKCYGCGLTKGIMNFIHFNFSKAWEYNKLTFIVVPMMAVLWVRSIYDIQGKRMPGKIGDLTYKREV